jgi:N6-L-threonylcarbamoyladenine synthase
MLILGIESSCDDTSVALVDCSPQGHFIISEKTASQIEVHKKYGGVVPEIAGRMHAEKIVPLIEEVLKNQLKPEIIAVTAGPGLVTGLIVGVEAARTLSYVWEIPVVAVNHIDGHIHSVEITKSKSQNENVTVNFPALCLVVSGGHTELILMKDHDDYTIVGRTKDDAAGECFDKVAKLLGFDYPGGPKVSKLAEIGTTGAINFPRPMLNQDNLDFSFAGLKTSALYWLRDHKLATNHVNSLPLPTGIFGQQTEGPTLNDFCASFEQAILDVLITKTLRTAEEYSPKTIILAGGVSANKKLRTTLEREVQNNFPKTKVLLSAAGYSMDNGAMIAVAGYYQASKKQFTPWKELEVNPNWKVDQPLHI